MGEKSVDALPEAVEKTVNRACPQSMMK